MFNAASVIFLLLVAGVLNAPLPEFTVDQNTEIGGTDITTVAPIAGTNATSLESDLETTTTTIVELPRSSEISASVSFAEVPTMGGDDFKNELEGQEVGTSTMTPMECTETTETMLAESAQQVERMLENSVANEIQNESGFGAYDGSESSTILPAEDATEQSESATENEQSTYATERSDIPTEENQQHEQEQPENLPSEAYYTNDIEPSEGQLNSTMQPEDGASETQQFLSPDTEPKHEEKEPMATTPPEESGEPATGELEQGLDKLREDSVMKVAISESDAMPGFPTSLPPEDATERVKPLAVESEPQEDISQHMMFLYTDTEEREKFPKDDEKDSNNRDIGAQVISTMLPPEDATERVKSLLTDTEVPQSHQIGIVGGRVETTVLPPEDYTERVKSLVGDNDQLLYNFPDISLMNWVKNEEKVEGNEQAKVPQESPVRETTESIVIRTSETEKDQNSPLIPTTILPAEETTEPEISLVGDFEDLTVLKPPSISYANEVDSPAITAAPSTNDNEDTSKAEISESNGEQPQPQEVSTLLPTEPVTEKVESIWNSNENAATSLQTDKAIFAPLFPNTKEVTVNAENATNTELHSKQESESSNSEIPKIETTDYLKTPTEVSAVEERQTTATKPSDAASTPAAPLENFNIESTTNAAIFATSQQIASEMNSKLNAEPPLPTMQVQSIKSETSAPAMTTERPDKPIEATVIELPANPAQTSSPANQQQAPVATPATTTMQTLVAEMITTPPARAAATEPANMPGEVIEEMPTATTATATTTTESEPITGTESVLVAAEPEPRALLMPPPKIDRYVSEDGVEVISGYSFVNHVGIS